MENKKRDLLIRHPVHENEVIRIKKDGEVSFGQLSPQREGEPISSEIVAVHNTPMSPMINECETVFDPEEHGISSDGPPKVNSDAYRANWERIFGSRDDAVLN